MDQDLLAIQQVRDLVKAAAKAQETLNDFTQEQVDRLVGAIARTAEAHAEELARLAVEETKYGRVESKVLKNLFVAKNIYAYVAPLKTAGVMRELREQGIVEIAEPVGVVAGIVPVTNPTSTAIFKIMIAIKSRNAIVLSPHPRSVRCVGRTAELLMGAIRREGAPEGAIGCLTLATLQATNELMKHSEVAVILATGGGGLVRAAYSSGKPAYGVGPGNTPAFIERTADVERAAATIVDSQVFDNGVICASEQSVIVDRNIATPAREAFKKYGGYFCSPEETAKLTKLVFKGESMNPETVGQSAPDLAKMTGLAVPPTATVLLCPLEGVGPTWPLSKEKLSPILAWYEVDGWLAGCHKCIELLELGGIGHTMVIHSRDEKVIREFGLKKPVFRVLVNAPSSQGAVGYATNLLPSMTLGCGAWGGNITSDNIGPLNLINIKRLAYVKPDYQPAVKPVGFAPAAPTQYEWRPVAEGKCVTTHNVSDEEIRRIIEKHLGSARTGYLR